MTPIHSYTAIFVCNTISSQLNDEWEKRKENEKIYDKKSTKFWQKYLPYATWDTFKNAIQSPLRRWIMWKILKNVKKSFVDTWYQQEEAEKQRAKKKARANGIKENSRQYQHVTVRVVKKRRLIWAIAFYPYILGLFSMRAKMDKTNSIAKLLPSLECNPIYGTLCHKCSWNAILHVESDNYYDTFPLLNWITNSLLIFFLEMHLFRSLFYVLT